MTRDRQTDQREELTATASCDMVGRHPPSRRPHLAASAASRVRSSRARARAGRAAVDGGPELDPDDVAPAGSGAGSDSRHRARARRGALSDMQALAAAPARRGAAGSRPAGGPEDLVEQVRFLGETNIKNSEAVENLMTMGKQHVYATLRHRLPISSVLPGVSVDVLGPPTLEQSADHRQPGASDADEFWHLAARRASAVRAARGAGERDLPRRTGTRSYPQEARWVIPQVDQMRAEEMLAIVRAWTASSTTPA